jgi:HK97 family phage major capsid protein
MESVVEPQDLNELRSTEELGNYQNDVKQRIVDLHKEFEGLPFPDEARDEYVGLTKTNDEIDRRVKELEARKFQLAQIAETNPRSVERIDSDASKYYGKPSAKEEDIYDTTRGKYRDAFGDPHKLRAAYREGAMRALELARFPYLGEKKTHNQVSREDVQAHIERLMERTQESQPGEVAQLLLHTGSPVYRRAYGKFLAGGVLSSEEQRALSLGATTGGQAVPFTLDPTVIPTSNSVVNPARALARIETISGSNTWNGVSSGAITATRVAEATAATDNTPTMAAPTLTVTKAHAFVPFSIEVQEDWGALEAEMGKLLQDAKDDDEGTQFVTGAGTTVFPQGFVTGTTATVAAATGLTVTAANVYALEAALAPRFRGNESFVANRGIYNIVRAIDTAGGAALWLYISQGLVTQSPTPGNTGATLLGRGAWEASAMQATVVNATKIMIVGNFQYFLIVDRIGMNIELIPFLFGAAQGNLPTGQRGLYAYWRNSSKVLSASAFVALTGTT